MQGVNNSQVLGGSSKYTIRQEISQSLDHCMWLNKIPYIDSHNDLVKYNLSLKREDIIMLLESYKLQSSSLNSQFNLLLGIMHLVRV